jgi:hypothetical protein
VPRLYPVRFHSLLRRRLDAATWTIAHDVSQRAEPDVRPLGRAASAFIAEKTRRLSIPLTDDVPPSTFNVSCPLRWQATSRPSCRRRACPVHLSAFRPRGVPGPTSELSPRATAQMGRRETEHEGGKKQTKGETRGLRVALRPGRVRLQ